MKNQVQYGALKNGITYKFSIAHLFINDYYHLYLNLGDRDNEDSRQLLFQWYDGPSLIQVIWVHCNRSKHRQYL